MKDKPLVLIVEDEILDSYMRNLYSDAYDMIGVRTLEEALIKLDECDFDVVVVDLKLPDSVEQGMRVIKKAKDLDATTAIIVVTANPNYRVAARTYRRFGVWDFFSKPFDFAFCRKRIYDAIQERNYRLSALEKAEQRGFIPIDSPYTVGSPLRAGDSMFFGHNEVFDFVRSNLGEPSNHNHLTLVGPRRIGKTSILQQLPLQLPPSVYMPVYINCQSLGIDPGMTAFFLKLAHQIVRGLAQQGVDVSSVPMPSTGLFGDIPPAIKFTETFLPDVYDVLGHRSLVLCFDEFEELAAKVRRQRLDVSVFDFLNDLMMEERQIAFVLVGTRRLTKLGVFCQPASRIIASTLQYEVDPFSLEITSRLVKEPVVKSGMFYQEDAIVEIQKLTGGYPYLVQLLCSTLVNLRNKKRKNEMTHQDVQEATSLLVETQQPGFFWESLPIYHKTVLLAVVQLWHRGQKVVKCPQVEWELQFMGVNLLHWPSSIQVADLLRELSFEGLLNRVNNVRGGVMYNLTFELAGLWLRRHKTIDEIW
jgi:ActR/RegA family two-component response regulator